MSQETVMNLKLATLCYVRSNGKTLMIHRVKKLNDVHKGKWNGLGGKLESGETPEECVIREVKEEAGLTISNPKLHGIITFPRFDDDVDWYVFVYSAESFDGFLIDSPEGDLEWVENDKLLDLNLWDGDEIFIRWMLENKFFSAKFVYEYGKLKRYEVVFH